jgi:AmmeMemoRadiSam system protein B
LPFSRPKLIVVLGPSHYKYLKNQCAISAFSSVQTPVGDIEIDIDIRERLVAASGEIFKISSRDDDLKEHSLEMQYPFIAKVFNGNNVRILPIQVGQFSDAMQRKYAAENLLKCIANIDSQDVMFVVSSDFCHYGPRFDYKPIFKESNLSLNENISILDQKALDTLNSSDPINAFTDYLKITGNTICGREPILFLHEIFNQSSIKGRWELIDYAQSNFLTSSNDNSVSYLSAIFKVSSQASGDAS